MDKVNIPYKNTKLHKLTDDEKNIIKFYHPQESKLNILIEVLKYLE